MRKFLLVIITFFLFEQDSYAGKISGGEISYSLLGSSIGWYRYRITLRLLRECDPNGSPLNADDEAGISIFDSRTDSLYWYQLIPRSRTEFLSMSTFNPCITQAPRVCYEAAYYEFDVILKALPGGYTIAYQECCSVFAKNLLPILASLTRLTYTAEIPGSLPLASGPANNSARFTGADTIVVCAGNGFTYNNAATDADGDQLVYSFCSSFASILSAIGPLPGPEPGPPPYDSLLFVRGYDGGTPLGPLVKINPSTGMIRGIAPQTGTYLITVSVSEIRNGRIIATQRKHLMIKTTNCQIAAAFLQPEYINCDSYALTFRNFSTSPLIHSYSWDFGINNSTNDTSNLATPTFNFPDSGLYTIKLVTNNGEPCSDSATAMVKVFPGFHPGFIVTGACFTHPFYFKDTTRAGYGVVDYWKWDFGDPPTTLDSSSLQNPSWTYFSFGAKDVSLIVTSSKGCMDTVTKTTQVIEALKISMAFHDSLICTPDNVQLLAEAAGGGSFSWLPNINIVNANTGTPTVNPVFTTWYYANLDINGCHARDSVKVRVVDHVTLEAGRDTTICLTDQLIVPAHSDGLQFQWSPVNTLNDQGIRNPVATPVDIFTTYQVHARIGSCSATDQITVKTVHYPVAHAGNDQSICYNTMTQLNGNMIGSSLLWSPAQYADHPAAFNPIVRPPRTTAFVLSAYDTLGCPKPGRDTVLVSVFPKLNVFAGSDTIVVVGQPLQLHASGGDIYRWSPATRLNRVDIPDPVAIFTTSDDEVKYKLIATNNNNGCADSAFVRVRVFKTLPDLFVPTAFTPNGDGLNDIFLPVPVGIKKLDYFSIYNRWGQLLFKTSGTRQGWDGKAGSAAQESGVYIWIASCVDYSGKPIFHKGYLTLIR